VSEVYPQPSKKSVSEFFDPTLYSKSLIQRRSVHDVKDFEYQIGKKSGEFGGGGVRS
jgi:hypothetical protein